jgi:hypothetical protein
MRRELDLGVQDLQELQNARLLSLRGSFGDLDVTPTRRHAEPPTRYSVRLAGLEKEAFGSVMFSFGVLPPLWHETSEIINPAKRSRAAHLNRFRISNDSRTNSGCKSTKTRCTKSDMSRRSIFGVFSIPYG